jgi:hypothetical protein
VLAPVHLYHKTPVDAALQFSVYCCCCCCCCLVVVVTDNTAKALVCNCTSLALLLFICGSHRLQHQTHLELYASSEFRRNYVQARVRGMCRVQRAIRILQPALIGCSVAWPHLRGAQMQGAVLSKCTAVTQYLVRKHLKDTGTAELLTVSWLCSLLT